MEYIVIILGIFAFVALVMLKGFYDEQKSRQRFIEWLRNNYGVLPEREEYTQEELKRIASYYKAHQQEGFSVDDITWNDLNMDSVFKELNYTYSAAGEEYLYYLLRTPIQGVEENTDAYKARMEKLEKHIAYFAKKEDMRIQYQILFAQIGKTGKYSIYDYLGYLDLLNDRDNKKYYFDILLIVFAAMVMLYSVQIGILFLITAVSHNMITYFKERKEIEPYITSFGYILRLMREAEEIEKNPAEAFGEEIAALRECRKAMGKFKAGSAVIMSSPRMNTNGDPLGIVMDYVRMIFHVDLIKFNNMLSEVRRNTETIDRMLTVIGYMETTIAIGCYRASGKSYCLPELAAGAGLTAENVYHPLIEEPVKSSIRIVKGNGMNQGVLITGSNASGKSTFLKTIAINAILAQTIHTVLADAYKAPCYRIMSSMALRDDLSGGDSYYIVEIKALKRILNGIEEKGNPVLCFVDEVLRGTNTVERIAASTQILKSLAKKNVICFAATHDIELTYLLENIYANYHFEEEINGDDIVFNYQLKKGRATTRNAIKLLGVMGYDRSLIEKAERQAENFMKNGVWEG